MTSTAEPDRFRAGMSHAGASRTCRKRWRADRAYLQANRRELTDLAGRCHPGVPRFGSSPLLTRPEWAPRRPVPLDAVTLRWSAPQGRETAIRPRSDLGGAPHGDRTTGARPAPRYSAMLAALDPPPVFVDRPAYRLLAADLVGVPVAEYTLGSYFDAIDIGEAAAHELAAAARSGARPTLSDLPIRLGVGDPTDPGRRPVPTAITMLTVRVGRAGGDARFLLHWRDPAKVATNGGLYTTVPVGMFQPAGAATGHPGSDDRDFDLWRCIAREYSEELLGHREHADVDYTSWPFFLDLERHRGAGTCRPYCLGIGVDPLNLAVDILAVTIFEAEAFDALFAGLVERNDEGRTVVGPGDGTIGTPLTAGEVHRLVVAGPMQPASAAVLGAAWRMRRALLGR